MKTLDRRSLIGRSIALAGTKGWPRAALPTGALAFGLRLPPGARAQDVAPTPTGEQVLRLAGGTQGPETLDPALARDLPTAFLLRQIYRGLMRLGPDLQPVPELAERVDVSDDSLVYTFTLRPNLSFHDGRPMLADDVVYSYTRALNPATAGGEAALLGTAAFLSDIAGSRELLRGDADSLAGVAALDEVTVEVRLSEPRAAFLMKIAAAQASIMDRLTVEADPEWWRIPNGSGPFRVTAWEPDEQMTLARFDGFYAGAPWLERVEFRLGPNAQNSFNLYQSDAIDIDGVPYDSVSRVLDPANPLADEVTVTPALGVFYAAFRTDEPPLDDPRVRRAIFLAFPRDQVAELTFDGAVSVAPGLLPNGMLGREWPVPMEPHDLEAARAELAASRYGGAADVPPIEIYTSSGSRPVEALREVLQTDLGLAVDVVQPDWPEFVDGLALGRFPSYAWYWGADYPDPENFIWTLFGEDSADNYVGYRNDAMNALIDEARRELDVERRADLYAEANALLMADHVVMPFYYDVSHTLAKPYVRGLDLTPQGIMGLETIWMER